MKQQIISIISPIPVREPRGAAMAASLAASLIGNMGQGARGLRAFGQALWRALEQEGQRRAAQQMKSSAVATAALEAAKVRRLADQHERTDPRFASELRAAASRHETLHGIE